MELDQEITETLTWLPSWVLGNHVKVEKLKCIWWFYVHNPGGCRARWWREDPRWSSDQFPLKSRAFSLTPMKLIDILLFLPFVIIWKGLNCITCKWRDLILAHYLFISENEQNISGSRNEGGGAALMERDRRTDRQSGDGIQVQS